MGSPEPTHTGVVAICNPNAQDGESEQAGKLGQFKPQALDTARKRTSIYMVEITHKATELQPKDSTHSHTHHTLAPPQTHMYSGTKKKRFQMFLSIKSKKNTILQINIPSCRVSNDGTCAGVAAGRQLTGRAFVRN